MTFFLLLKEKSVTLWNKTYKIHLKLSFFIRSYSVRILRPTMKTLIDFKSCKLVLMKTGSNYLTHICDLAEFLTDCAAAWIWPCSWNCCRYDEWDLLCAEGSLETKAARRRIWSTHYRCLTIRTTVHETVFVFQQLSYNNYSKQNTCSKFFKVIARKRNVSESLWNDLYVLLMSFTWGSSGAFPRERHKALRIYMLYFF